MSVRYEVVRLLARLGIAFAVALGLAAIVALVRGGGYHRSLELSCYLTAAFMFVLAAAGNSPGRGYGLDVESAQAGSSRWRTILGDPANPPSGALAPAVPFVVAAVVLILVGVTLGYAG
jgi:hypothetical protein